MSGTVINVQDVPQLKFEMTLRTSDHEVQIYADKRPDGISVKFNFITQQRNFKDFFDNLPSVSRLSCLETE